MQRDDPLGSQKSPISVEDGSGVACIGKSQWLSETGLSRT